MHDLRKAVSATAVKKMPFLASTGNTSFAGNNSKMCYFHATAFIAFSYHGIVIKMICTLLEYGYSISCINDNCPMERPTGKLYPCYRSYIGNFQWFVNNHILLVVPLIM